MKYVNVTRKDIDSRMKREQPQKTPAKSLCLPDRDDIEWMTRAVQRHTGGFDVWWEQNRDKLSGREWLQIFLTIWEAGNRRRKTPALKSTKPAKPGRLARMLALQAQHNYWNEIDLRQRKV